MKYLWFFKLFDVIKHISALNISLTHLTAADYNEIYNEQAIMRDHHDDVMRITTWKANQEANRYQNNMNSKLRRQKRYSASTIDGMTDKQISDLIQQQQNVREHQNCQQKPCQKRPFIIPYQVGTPTQLPNLRNNSDIKSLFRALLWNDAVFYQRGGQERVSRFFEMLRRRQRAKFSRKKNLTRPEDGKLLRPDDYIDVGTCSGHCLNADADKL